MRAPQRMLRLPKGARLMHSAPVPMATSVAQTVDDDEAPLPWNIALGEP